MGVTTILEKGAGLNEGAKRRRVACAMSRIVNGSIPSIGKSPMILPHSNPDRALRERGD
jgi:hypothetical protein